MLTRKRPVDAAQLLDQEPPSPNAFIASAAPSAPALNGAEMSAKTSTFRNKLFVGCI